ncbi:MAG TPA: DUF1559 domain-containing protein, partial [Gemmataceae bacterium]|nr:DUF1559 domain-containing protein [Gemmataceae bacterium]
MSTRLIRPAVGPALALTAALLCLPACGKKDADTDGDSGGGSDSPGPSRVTEPGVPAPPSFPPRASGGRARANSQNNLRQIGMALHNFHDVNGFLPAGYYDKSGKGLGLSWRVAILPYIEEAKLWQEFHLDEPWNSEHNIQLVKRMPKVFASSKDPKLAEQGKTTFLAPVHKDAVFTGGPQGIRIGDIADGTSHTILLVDADESAAVVWTKPEELEYAA